MQSHHNIYITSHDFDLKTKKKHHQQIKVIRHATGISAFMSCIVQIFFDGRSWDKDNKKTFYMARLSGKKKSY